ncbi:4'-phosphopantetheinyl transferase family protein [Streptomyces sp. NPDC020898]|uniref:4'-phosphopantetheinyl transferase family protein n=1 Tax=Streptomyces sp. NPDC020898 TaxID=3365101 RepID=UPI0037B22277
MGRAPAPPARLSLPAHDLAHLWWIALDGQDPYECDRLFDVLDPSERQRCGKLSSPGSRVRFTVSHGAARCVLARYLGIRPHNIRTTTSRWGKPELDGIKPILRFNLSHVDGIALLAIARTREIGVDIERRRDAEFVSAVSARHFARNEARWLAATPCGRREAVFLRLWTRKEASVKAVGGRLGDGLPLPVAGRCRSLVVPAPGNRTGSLRLRDIRAPRDHAAAVALTGALPFRAVHHWWRPEFTESTGAAVAPAITRQG